jgi:Rab-GTPase-TBC domain
MNRELLFTFYSFDMERVNVVFHVFMVMMKDRLPKLHGAFKATNISCSIFLFEWIVALFSNIFPLETSARLWDAYLFFGDFYLLKIAIGICYCLE